MKVARELSFSGRRSKQNVSIVLNVSNSMETNFTLDEVRIVLTCQSILRLAKTSTMSSRLISFSLVCMRRMKLQIKNMLLFFNNGILPGFNVLAILQAVVI